MKKRKVSLMIANMIATALVSSVATFIVTTTICQVKTEKYIREKLYPRTAIVTDINRQADFVKAECANGNPYYFYGASDYEIGDIVSLIAKKNMSRVVTDDAVVSNRYDGFIELLEQVEAEIE